MIEYKTTLKELIKDKETWRQLKPELSTYNVHSTETGEKDTRAGKIFEVFTKLYFLVSPTEKDNFKNVWLFEETPLEVRNKLNLGNQDYGVDLVLQDIEDQYFVVQCKYKNDESSKLNWSADKIANLFAFCPNANGYIVFSNAVDLDNVSKTRHDNFTFYGVANLNEIDKETFRSIYSLLAKNHLEERKLFDPLPHQVTAIDECTQWFTEGEESRGQLILPCGAGKTFTALWIKEKLQSKNTLVLVPSLALLRQIKNEWSKQRKNIYQYLCVCSETDIDKDTTDTLVTHTYEIDTRVTTNSEHVKSFLLKSFEGKVIFSTYHSLPVIADAIQEISFEFDFTFCDEAHKTAGVGNNKFSLVHNNNRIPSKYRLYATATPRIVSESLKKKLGDDLKYAYDMNDPDTFGHEFHRMTFKNAIEKEILVDYKIVAIGVNSDELKEYIEKRIFIDKNISIDELANNYALDHVMNKYNANHGLTFHSRVKLAEEFANRHGQLFPNTRAFSVSGEQPTSYRNLVLEQFKNSDKAIVSNARCLTEGVDVPTIDLVYFCDPKNSKVDIVQAVGRALRKKEGKKLGLIVVPIYHSKKHDLESSISSGSFKNLLQVIRSLCDQDERLQDEINFVAFGKGKRESTKINIVSSVFLEEQDKIILEGFEEKLRNSLFDQIIEKSSNNWDLWFFKLKEFIQANSEYPTEKHNIELYRWVAQQRTRKTSGKLANEETRKLNSINFIWNYQEWKWNQMFNLLLGHSQNSKFEPTKENKPELYKWYVSQKTQLKNNALDPLRIKLLSSIQFKGSHKDIKWYANYERYKKFSLTNEFEPDTDSEPYLYRWIVSQKNQIRNGLLGIEKVELFESVSFRSGVDKKWTESYEQLVTFKNSNANKWPQYNRNDPNATESKLHVFCQTMRRRFRENELSDYWFDKMVELDFNFDGKTDNWTKYFEEVKELISDKDSISADQIGNNAYSWILRHKKQLEEGNLSKLQSKKIQSLNLDRFFETWNEKFERVKNWVLVNQKIPTPKAHKDFNSWLYSQRSRFKNGRLGSEQISKLRELGFDLEGLGNERNEEKWIGYFEQLKNFIKENERYPGPTNEKDLYIWVQSQRAAKAGNLRNRKPLYKNRIDLLDSINFKWIGAVIGEEETWNERFEEFSKFVQNGNLTLPSLINGVRNPLYSWWINQKISFKKNVLPKDKAEALTSLGLSLKMDGKQVERTWEENFEELKNFIDSSGIVRIPHEFNGSLNPLYSWFRNQKTAFRKGYMSANRIKKFKEIGVSFIESSNENIGFSKWSKNLYQIAKFINENGHYPRPSTSDNQEARYYQSLARTKRAFKNKELSDTQIDLLNELNIKLS